MIRENEDRAKKRERWRKGEDRKLSPSGPAVSLPEHTQTDKHTHTEAQTHRCKQLFSCCVLFSFQSHKQYLTNQHPHNISVHPDVHLGTHMHTEHMCQCETDTLTDRQTDSMTDRKTYR